MHRSPKILIVLIACAFACSASSVQPTKSSPTAGHGVVAGSDATDDEDGSMPIALPAGSVAPPTGNQRIRSFEEAKRVLGEIYEPHRIDLYCACPFAPEKGKGLRVDLAACGYVVLRDQTRASRIEWEHAIPASWFGKTFTEWIAGDDRCTDSKGKKYKGRKCAGHSQEFARIEGDMHNLFPVVGEVNAIRSDFPIGLPDASRGKGQADVFKFGACTSTIEKGVFFPRLEVRGDLARASLYMNKAYPDRHLLTDAHRTLFEKWSADDPADAWERERNRLIAAKQGNANSFIEEIVLSPTPSSSSSSSSPSPSSPSSAAVPPKTP